MDPIVGLLAIGAVLYLAYSSGALSAPAGSNIVTAPVAPIAANPVTPPQTTLIPNIGSSITASSIQQEMPSNTASTAVGISGMVGSSSVVLAHVGLAASAVPVVGVAVAAVAAITSALLAAHQQRIKAARDENSATNLGVQGWDKAMQQINAAYNARQLTATDAISLVQLVMQQFWQEVTPHIQSGRNGCNGGSGCPPWPAKGNGCSGNIGAACCVGCYDLEGGPSSHVFGPADGGDNSTAYFFGSQGTQIVLAHGGGKVLYQHVYGSKYGGADRPGYILNWQQVSAA